MARPLRIEFAGAMYHVTSRGNAKQQIYGDDLDRERFLAVLDQVVTRLGWICSAYCLMGNHYHLLIETPVPNLGRGMRQLNGVYAQWHNARHQTVGHLFQSRYNAVLVERETHWLELARYLALNPVRGGVVADPADWRWSSYRATAGLDEPPAWLAVDDVLAGFANETSAAQQAFARFVAEGRGIESPWSRLSPGGVLGSAEFASRCRERLGSPAALRGATMAQRQLGRPALAEVLDWPESASRDERDKAIHRAHVTYEYRLGEIADLLGVHTSTVSRAIKRAEE